MCPMTEMRRENGDRGREEARRHVRQLAHPWFWGFLGPWGCMRGPCMRGLH